MSIVDVIRGAATEAARNVTQAVLGGEQVQTSSSTGDATMPASWARSDAAEYTVRQAFLSPSPNPSTSTLFGNLAPGVWGAHQPSSLAFAGSPTDRGDEPEPQPVPAGTEAQVHGPSGAEYELGEPTRPDIHHDNGFLQNPDDPNDPVPQPTREPTSEEVDYYNSELERATWADRIPGPLRGPIGIFKEEATYDDGIEAYRHFLEGDGADRHFDYGEFIEEDEAGRLVAHNAAVDTQQAAEAAYAQIVAENPELAGQPITFEITGGPIGVTGASDHYPYPETANWQKAIGGHTIWNSATVTVTPDPDGGPPRFEMDMTTHAEDRYNFNPDQHDIETGAPDALRGRLEEAGLAHQYNQYGTYDQHVEWTRGDIPALDTGGDSGR